MVEYIDREALLADFAMTDFPWMEFDDAWEIVQNAPVVDVAPVQHGRWINEDFPEKVATENDCAICSVCKEFSHTAEHGYAILSTYCPYCGAKMDGIIK